MCLFILELKASLFIQSKYSSELTVYSRTYSPTGCELSDYYYEAIQINVTRVGYYTFRSNSTIDTYGHFYMNNFDPFNPTVNLQAEDDNRCINRQFGITTYLQMNTTYILIVTTSSPDVVGSFSIFGSGPSNVIFNRISE